MLIVGSSMAVANTGHGSALPPLVHGGPGRAGGGQEMSAMRGVFTHSAPRWRARTPPGTEARWERGWGRYSLCDVTATMDITADWLTSSTISA